MCCHKCLLRVSLSLPSSYHMRDGCFGSFHYMGWKINSHHPLGTWELWHTSLLILGNWIWNQMAVFVGVRNCTVFSGNQWQCDISGTQVVGRWRYLHWGKENTWYRKHGSWRIPTVYSSVSAVSYYIVLYCVIIYLWYDIFVNCKWVVTRWQLYSTHLHTNNTQNDTKQTMHRTTQNLRIQKFWSSALCCNMWNDFVHEY